MTQKQKPKRQSQGGRGKEAEPNRHSQGGRASEPKSKSQAQSQRPKGSESQKARAKSQRRWSKARARVQEPVTEPRKTVRCQQTGTLSIKNLVKFTSQNHADALTPYHMAPHQTDQNLPNKNPPETTNSANQEGSE